MLPVKQNSNNMKGLISLVLSSLLLGACSFFQKGYPDLPSFNLLMLDSSTVLNTKEIPGGSPFILIYFSPDCRECRTETEQILKNISSFKDVRLYFISIDPLERIKLFQKVYKTDRYRNITLARDYEWSFPRLYEAKGTPFTVVYDKNRQLRGVFSGETDVNIVISMLSKLM